MRLTRADTEARSRTTVKCARPREIMEKGSPLMTKSLDGQGIPHRTVLRRPGRGPCSMSRGLGGPAALKMPLPKELRRHYAGA